MVKDKEMTTIKVPKWLTKKLKKYKVYPRETYTEVIDRALQGEAFPSGNGGSPSNSKKEVKKK